MCVKNNARKTRKHKEVPAKFDNLALRECNKRNGVQKSVLRLVCITKGQSCFNQAIYIFLFNICAALRKLRSLSPIL